MAAVAGPLDRRCSSVQSVDIDPGWYEGQPETADATDQEAALLFPAAADQQAALKAAAQPSSQTAAGSAPAAAPAGGSHVPTVLTKLQKWGDYESFGQPVWPTKFLPMKTPLSHEILDNWQLPEAPKHRLTVSTLLEAQKAAGRKVGLLLDLSNHDCLYDTDIPSDVQYIHVQLVAKELPPLEFVREVARAANAFWAQHPDMYIAVHCAYGFNRTGFVLCSYLIEHCGLTVDQALQSFAASRPPGVKHEKFRLELWARYDGSGSNSAISALAVPVPTTHQQHCNSSASNGSPLLSAAAVSAAGSLGRGSVGGYEGRALSCRSCGSNSSATTAGWPLGGSPLVGSAGGADLMLAHCSSPVLQQQQQQQWQQQQQQQQWQQLAPASPSTTAAGPATVAAPATGCGDCSPTVEGSSSTVICSTSPLAAGVLRCCCCNAALTAEDAAAAAAVACSPSAAAAGAGKAATPRRSLPDFSASCVDGPTTTSCFARSSSTGAVCQTPPPAPLPPMLAPSGGSRPLLSSSPALRISGRCWSSHSIGDNSSIGCSPSSSTADLVTLRTSGLNSAHSSCLDSSMGGAPDTPNNPYSGAGAAATADGSSPVSRGGLLLSQQWLAGSALERSVSSRSSNHRRRGSSSGGASGEGLQFVNGVERGSSGGGCSSSGVEGACEDDAADEGCFEMDPYIEPVQQYDQQYGQQYKQQQQQYMGVSSQQPNMRQKTVTFQDEVCCDQAAPTCGSVQQLQTADIESLLASVSISHQQQQQLAGQQGRSIPQQQHYQQNQQLPQKQSDQQAVAAEQCSCSCHTQQPQQHAAGPAGSKQADGSSIQQQDAGTAYGSGGSSGSTRNDRQWYQEEELNPRVEVARGRGYYSSEDGVADNPLENESFGKITSADLLKHLRNLQKAAEPN